MVSVKIYGAGSIGNHLAYGCRQKGWTVLICDTDKEALKRTKTDIYPKRYGQWDDGIRLELVKDIRRNEEFDVVIIGTPPEYHLQIAKQVLQNEEPDILLIEKPLCPPTLELANEIHALSEDTIDTVVLCGYNHTLCKNTLAAEKELLSMKNPLAINSGFQEYWGGIFKAHPWLDGPQDSYLGKMVRGGGASGEHSHAINIWQHFAHKLKKGRITEVTARLDMVDTKGLLYDRMCNIAVKTDSDFFGTIIQDVITEPPKKYVYVQGEEKRIEWYANYEPNCDAVITYDADKTKHENLIRKTRPDDFKGEIEHIDDIIEGKTEPTDSPIYLDRGLDTMLVIAAAHWSHAWKRTVHIDYKKGYTLDAIKGL